MNNAAQVAREYIRKLSEAYELPEIQAQFREIRDLHERK
jgi:hypothetical protein